MIYVVSAVVVVASIAAFLIGAFVGHEDGYEQGVRETHDYYHAKGVRR